MWIQQPPILIPMLKPPAAKPGEEFYNKGQTEEGLAFISSFKPLLAYCDKGKFLNDFQDQLKGTQEDLLVFGLDPNNQESWENMLINLESISKVIGSLDEVDNLLKELAAAKENPEIVKTAGYYDVLTVFCLRKCLDLPDEIPQNIKSQLETQYQSNLGPLFSQIKEEWKKEDIDEEAVNNILGGLKNKLISLFGAIPQDVDLILSGQWETKEQLEATVNYLENDYLQDRFDAVTEYAENQDAYPEIDEVYSFVIKKVIEPASNRMAGNIGVNALNQATKARHEEEQKSAIEMEKTFQKQLNKIQQEKMAQRSKLAKSMKNKKDGLKKKEGA